MDMPLPPVRPLSGGPPAGWREEAAALVRLAGPLVGANLLQMAVYASDVIFVARLGTEALAASTLAVYLYSVILFALSGLASAAAPLIAAELGRRRHAVREVRRSFRMALWLAIGSVLLFMIPLSQARTILGWMGQDPRASAEAGQFMRILLLAMVPAVSGGVMRIAVAALGRPGWAMVVAVIGLATNIFGNWVLVFGHLGMPAMGLNGSATASVITSWMMIMAYAAIVLRDPKIRRYRLFGRWWRPEWPRAWQLIKLGVPIAVTMTLEGAIFSGAAFLMGLIGVTEVAAHAVALQIAAVAFQVPFGVSQAATIRVGMAYGARDHAWIGLAGRVALILGIGFMATTAIALWIAPRSFVHIYLADTPDNARTIALAVQYLAVAAAFQLFDGAQVVGAGVLRGVQDTRVPMIIAAISYWVAGFGTAIVLGFTLGLAGLGIWIGLAAGLAVVAILLLGRWRLRARFGLLPLPAHG